MDTNIKIVEKIDPWTILGRTIKMQKTPDSSRLWVMETSIRSLKLVEIKLRTQQSRQKLCDNQRRRYHQKHRNRILNINN